MCGGRRQTSSSLCHGSVTLGDMSSASVATHKARDNKNISQQNSLLTAKKRIKPKNHVFESGCAHLIQRKQHRLSMLMFEPPAL